MFIVHPTLHMWWPLSINCCLLFFVSGHQSPPSLLSLFFYFCRKDKRHGQTRQLSRIDYDRAPCLSYCSHLVCPVKCANLFHMCFGSPARNLIVSREFPQIPNLQADLQAEGRLEFLSWSLSVYRVILDTYVSPHSILGS